MLRRGRPDTPIPGDPQATFPAAKTAGRPREPHAPIG